MFNLQGSEIIFILLLALVVLGPEKLPGAIKRVTQTYAELRKLGTGFQDEFRAAIDEPMREMRETAELVKDQADPKKIAEEAERAAHAAAAADRADAALVAANPSGDGDAECGDDAQTADDLGDPFEDPVDHIDEFDDPVDVVEMSVDENPDGTEAADAADASDEAMEETA